MKSSTARHSAARADARMGLRAEADSINRVPTAHRGMVSEPAQRLHTGHCLSKTRAWDSMATRPARNSSQVWQIGLRRHHLAVSTAPHLLAHRGMQAVRHIREAPESDIHPRLSAPRGRRPIPRQHAAPHPEAIHGRTGPAAGKKIPRLSSTVIGKAMVTMKPRQREMPAKAMC